MTLHAEDTSGSAGGRALRGRDILGACASVGLGLAFGGLVWGLRGAEPARQYAAGYLVELGLSADNVLVFALALDRIRLDPGVERRTLFLGVLGAVVLRSAFILVGLGAIHRFAWLAPLLGLLLIVAGARAALPGRGRAGFDPSRGAVGAALARFPGWLAALVAVEVADLVFALDSLPAVMAVTHDPLIAISSNLFAILGLRSLFFVVRSALGSLRHLKSGLALVLALVGAKMLADPWYQVPSSVTLAAVAAVLGASVAASLLGGRRDAKGTG